RDYSAPGKAGSPASALSALHCEAKRERDVRSDHSLEHTVDRAVPVTDPLGIPVPRQAVSTSSLISRLGSSGPPTPVHRRGTRLRSEGRLRKSDLDVEIPSSVRAYPRCTNSSHRTPLCHRSYRGSAHDSLTLGGSDVICFGAVSKFSKQTQQCFVKRVYRIPS